MGVGRDGIRGIFVGELCINCIKLCVHKKNHVCIYLYTCVYVYIYAYQQINKKNSQVLCFIKRTYNSPQRYISD